MRIPFRYIDIEESTIAELTDYVHIQESIVLLGARHSGKRFVMGQIRDRLEQQGVSPIVYLPLLRQTILTTTDQVMSNIRQAIQEATGLDTTRDDIVDDQIPEVHLLTPIERLARRLNKPVVLMAANVDGMADSLARRFLQAVRLLVEDRKVIVILSGEHDFRDLVYGPNSEFACANQFVLQRYDITIFASRVEQYIEALHIRFIDSHIAIQRLWQLTGGNIHLARMALWILTDSNISMKKTISSIAIASDVVLQALDAMTIAGTYGEQMFRNIIQLIRCEPDCWHVLEQLLRAEHVKIDVQQSAPTHLELAGLAIRVDRRLQFASSWMEKFARAYYNPRRLGDLYANNGTWYQAFKQYERMEVEETKRPLGIEDRADVVGAVDSLCAAMHSAAEHGVNEIQQLFVLGCRYLLGFNDISFWREDTTWKLLRVDGLSAVPNKINILEMILDSGDVSKDWMLKIPAPWDRHVVANWLPDIHREMKRCVIVADFDETTVLTRERHELITQLLRHFSEAYTHTINVARNRDRLWVRNQQIQIINSIFHELGNRVRNPRQTLEVAAKGLRDLGYRRVLFCLVDARRERIQGVHNDNADGIDLVALTDWPLNRPNEDLQPYVIQSRQSKVVPDAVAEPLANPDVVRHANMKALAVVPILNLVGEAIGTIHVEREDSAMPAVDEVNDLLEFGRHLAIAIEQSERVNLLQSALDKLREPVLIVDGVERLRYANQSAQQLLHIVSDGWLDPSQSLDLPDVGNAALWPALKGALEHNHRDVRHFTGIGQDAQYRGEWLIEGIKDWRQEKTAGALIHIADLNYLDKILRALGLIAGVDNYPHALQAMLNATELLGHEWGRLYLIDEQHPDEMVSQGAFGFPNVQDQQLFAEHGVRLPRRREVRDESWMCIDQMEPKVFCWLPDYADFESVITEQGLTATNVIDPSSPSNFKQKVGNFWIDFPLIAQQKPLGKLTLSCTRELRPEQFELLKILSLMAAGLLDAILRRDKAAADKEVWIRQAIEKSMSYTAHSIATRLAALMPLRTRYRLKERDLPSLRELNNDFESVIGETINIINDIKKRLAWVHAKPEEIKDVIGYIQSIMHDAGLSETQWEIRATPSLLTAHLDRGLMADALLELIQNSSDLIRPTSSMRLSLELEAFVRNHRHWLRLIYADNGPGVRPELKEKIFQDAFSERPGGRVSTGLGLGLVRRIMEAHGGGICENGDYGRGARFVIELPNATVQTVEGGSDAGISHSDRG